MSHRPRYPRPLRDRIKDLAVLGSAVALVVAGTLIASVGPVHADDGTGRDPAPPTTLTDQDRRILAEEQAARQMQDFAFRNGALGVYRDAASGTSVIRVPASGEHQITARDLASAGLTKARVSTSRLTSAAVDGLRGTIRDRAWHSDAPRYSYAFHYDARQDAVVVNTDAPGEVTKGLSAAGAVVTMTPTTRDSRTNDATPHWGGASISGARTVCTSGFSVQNSAGTRFMVTAGHCFNLNDSIISTEGGQSFGTITSRAPFPTWDLEIMGGASYGTYIYTGDASGVGTHVIGADNPALDFTGYCRSGQTTFEQCGHTVTSLDGEFCDSAGCTPSLIVYSGGGASAGGDSGAPFYLPGSNGVWIRGVHIARAGSNMYAEKWSTIQNYFEVSIVT